MSIYDKNIVSMYMMNTKNLGKLATQFFRPQDTKSILYNKYLLWGIFVLSLFNLYYKMVSGNLMFLVRFLLIGFVASFFSRNMMVILFLALALTNLLDHGMRNIHEGMEDGMDKEEKEGMEEEDKEKEGAEDMAAEGETVSPKETTKDSAEGETPKKEPAKKKMAEEKKENDVAQEGIQDLTHSAEELLKIQKDVLQNFDVIEPKMKRAEQLIGKMNSVAEQMQNIRR